MTAPNCPIHQQPMRAGNRPGNFYCTTFVGIGQPGTNAKGYCAQTINPPRNAQASPQAAPTPVPAPAVAVSPPGHPGASQTPSRASLACAALNAAAMLSNTGTPLEMVIATADRLLHGFLIPASQGRQTTPAPQQDADLAPFS